MPNKKKPTLVLFTDKHDNILPHFKSGHVDYLLKALSTHFNVVEINQDCDYSQVVNQHHPDLILFDGGILHSLNKQPVVIHNYNQSCPIPKAGLIRVDAISAEMHLVLEHLDKYAITRYFAIDTGLGEAWPHLKPNIFYWPWSFDDTLYKDHRLEKIIPITMIGEGFSTPSPYIWRKSMFTIATPFYPILLSNRPRNNSPVAIHTEQYARILNQSRTAFGCGCERFILTRKLIEIPACNTLLVTEQSDVLEAAGFQDKVNCLFTDDSNLLDKLEWIFSDFNRLDSITRSGYDLVHKQHNFASRTQILDWFSARSQGIAEDNLLQSNPFSSVIVKTVEKKTAPHLHTGTESFLSTIRRKITAAIKQQSVTKLAECENELARLYPSFYESLPEFRIIQTLLALVRGTPYDATRFFCLLLNITDVYGYKRQSHSLLEHFLFLWLAKIHGYSAGIRWFMETFLDANESSRLPIAIEYSSNDANTLLTTLVDHNYKLDEFRTSEHPVAREIFHNLRQDLHQWLQKAYPAGCSSADNQAPRKIQANKIIFGIGEIGFATFDRCSEPTKVDVFIHNFSRETSTCKGIPALYPEDIELTQVDEIIITNRTYLVTALQLILLGAKVESILVLERTSNEIIPLTDIVT